MVWLLLSAVAYSSIVVLIKGAVAAGVNAETALTVRFGVAALVFWSMAVARERPRWPGVREAIAMIALGLCYMLNSFTFYCATSELPGSTAAMTFGIVPVVVALISWALGLERLGIAGCVSLCLVVLGALMLMGMTRNGGVPVSGTGIGWLTVSVLLCSIHFVASVPLAREGSAMVNTTYVVTGAAISAVVLGWTVGRIRLDHGVNGWLALIGLAILPTVAGMLTFMMGLRTVSATQAAVVSALEPVSGAVLAVLLLGERPGHSYILGGLLVVLASAVVQWERTRPTRRL